MKNMSDDRTLDKEPIKNVRQWAVATDKFLSGWGYAPNKSYIAYSLNGLGWKQRDALFAWMQGRSDFCRVRITTNLPRLQEGCHLSIADIPNFIRAME